MQTATAHSFSPRDVVIQPPGTGEATWFLDNLIVTKVSGRDGAAMAVLEAQLPAGSRTPFHRHQGEDEAFYLLEGEMTFFLEGDRVYRATAGTYVHVPTGVAHGFRTESAVRVLVLTGVDGFAEMVRAAGKPAPTRELPPLEAPDLECLGRAAHDHRIQLLGPLPE